MIRNIAISGGIGTGKTTLANNLTKKLGWRHLNNGEIIRAWFKDHQGDVNEVDKIPEQFDREIDQVFQQKMQQEDHVIFESRLAGWQARESSEIFKVLCTSTPEVAVERAAKRDGIESMEEEKQRVLERDEGLRKKFAHLYGVTDYLDPKYFDLVVDTTTLTPEQVLEKVIQKLTSLGVVK